MEEEIDIAELLKRVKEGKAPKKIEINGYRYELNDFNRYYREGIDGDIYNFVDEYDIFDILDTKIKILDKPIIEELEEKIHGISLGDTNRTLLYVIKKINEIIEKINEEEK